MALTDEIFVRLYMKALKEGIHKAQLAREMGISRQFLGDKIRRMRLRGITLPDLPDGYAGKNRQSTDELNRIIADLTGDNNAN